MAETLIGTVAEWQTFYAVTAGAAATLIGLVFVALSLNPAVVADDRSSGLREWAAQTFGNFLTLLVVALVCRIPDPTRASLGLPLLGIGAEGLVRGTARLRRVRADPDPVWHVRHARWRFVAPAAAYLAILGVGLGTLRGAPEAPDWLVATVFLLVSSAAGSCWKLLKEIGNRRIAAAPSVPSPPPGPG